VSASDSLEPLGATTALVVVDMQRLFAEETDWHVPALREIVPAVRRLAAHRPDAALFTRFVTPPSVHGAGGRWRHYYGHWSNVTLDTMSPAMLDLVEELAPLAAPEAVCNKATFSAFADGPLPDVLRTRQVDTLVLAGAETDVCVLATALDAVDRGYRVVVARDAVTSSSPAGHRAAIEGVLPRFDLQIDIATVDRILAAWQEG
jgi:nicotinamidase-related amidase